MAQRQQIVAVVVAVGAAAAAVVDAMQGAVVAVLVAVAVAAVMLVVIVVAAGPPRARLVGGTSRRRIDCTCISLKPARTFAARWLDVKSVVDPLQHVPHVGAMNCDHTFDTKDRRSCCRCAHGPVCGNAHSAGIVRCDGPLRVAVIASSRFRLPKKLGQPHVELA